MKTGYVRTWGEGICLKGVYYWEHIGLCGPINQHVINKCTYTTGYWLIVCCSFEYPTTPYVCVHQINVTLHSLYIFLPAHSLSTASASFSGVSASTEGHSLRQRWTHPHYTWTGNYNLLLVGASWYCTDGLVHAAVILTVRLCVHVLIVYDCM